MFPKKNAGAAAIEYTHDQIDTLLNEKFYQLTGWPILDNAHIHPVSVLESIKNQAEYNINNLSELLETLALSNLVTHLFPCYMGRHFFLVVIQHDGKRVTPYYIQSVKNPFDDTLIRKLNTVLRDNLGEEVAARLKKLRLNQQTEVSAYCACITVQNCVDIATGRVKLSQDNGHNFSIRRPEDVYEHLNKQREALAIVQPEPSQSSHLGYQTHLTKKNRPNWRSDRSPSKRQGQQHVNYYRHPKRQGQQHVDNHIPRGRQDSLRAISLFFNQLKKSPKKYLLKNLFKIFFRSMICIKVINSRRYYAYFLSERYQSRTV